MRSAILISTLVLIVYGFENKLPVDADGRILGIILSVFLFMDIVDFVRGK